MQIVWRYPLRMLLVLAMCLWFGVSYVELNNKNEIYHFYEEHSHMPIMQLFHNRHFAKSRQFQDFLDVVEETEYRNKDYAQIVLTDCEHVTGEPIDSCENMKRTKDNRMIVGFYPSNQFINFGGKMMQNPPKSKLFDHPTDVYTVDELQIFFSQMIPNFYKEINNINEFEEYKSPKYSPKLIFVSREQQIPEVLTKLSVHFYLRLEFYSVSDLTENVIKQLGIKKYPTLLVYKYSFSEQKFLIYPYNSTDFSYHKYEEIKAFFNEHALQQPRNDILFHKIKIAPESDLITVETQPQLDQFLERTQGWTIISNTKHSPQRLLQLKKTYGRYFQYVHFYKLDAQDQNQQIQLYSPAKKSSFPLKTNEIQFAALSKDDFISNSTIWLSKNFVVIGVREKYGHFCSIAQKTLFRGLTQCLIVKQQDVEEVGAAIGMQVDIGFACAQKRQVEGEKRNKVSGQTFKSTEYSQVYVTVQYQTRMKAKDIIDQFMEQPVDPITDSSLLKELCAFPTKKCALLFTDSHKKDTTSLDYLAEIAKNYINQYHFYAVDINCNHHFTQEIQHLAQNHAALLVYHPKTATYVLLKAKINKNNILKFLKVNLSENKKLPHTSFINEKITVNACPQTKTAQDQIPDDSL